MEAKPGRPTGRQEHVDHRPNAKPSSEDRACSREMRLPCDSVPSASSRWTQHVPPGGPRRSMKSGRDRRLADRARIPAVPKIGSCSFVSFCSFSLIVRLLVSLLRRWRVIRWTSSIARHSHQASTVAGDNRETPQDCVRALARRSKPAATLAAARRQPPRRFEPHRASTCVKAEQQRPGRMDEQVWNWRRRKQLEVVSTLCRSRCRVDDDRSASTPALRAPNSGPGEGKTQRTRRTSRLRGSVLHRLGRHALHQADAAEG